jgi:hypothetical protein
MTDNDPTDADYDRLADLAEQGFDPATFHARRRGRPSLGQEGISPRIATRVPAQVRDRARERAAREGRTLSEVLRGMVEEYASGAGSAQSAGGRSR